MNGGASSVRCGVYGVERAVCCDMSLSITIQVRRLAQSLPREFGLRHFACKYSR